MQVQEEAVTAEGVDRATDANATHHKDNGTSSATRTHLTHAPETLFFLRCAQSELDSGAAFRRCFHVELVEKRCNS